MAQQTMVMGQITDRTTGEPIANANIVLRHSTDGAATDADGFYILTSTDSAAHILDISAIGYSPITVRIKPFQQAALHVSLRPQPKMLDQLVVLPKRNDDAYLLLRAAADGMNKHTTTSAYTTAYINNLDAGLAQRKFWKKIFANYDDTTSLIPVYHHTPSHTTSAVLSAVRYESLLTPVLQNIDFTDKSLLIGNNACPNPLSPTARRWYNFYLADSTDNVDGNKIYTVHFRTKNPYSLSFNGEVLIDSAKCKITSLSASIPSTANINIVRQLSLSQTFADGSITDERRQMLLDFVMHKDSAFRKIPTLYARSRLVHNSDILPSDTTDEKFANATDSVILSISKTRFMRFLSFAGTTLLTYHMPAGYVDVGDIFQLFSFNKQERFRIGIPLRTSERLMRDWVIGGYVAYGFRDRGWKYSAYVQYQTPTELRHLVGVRVTDDYGRIGQHTFQYFLLENRRGRGFGDLTTSLLNFMAKTTDYNPHRHVTLYTMHDITPNIELNAELNIGQTAMGAFDDEGLYVYHKYGQYEYFNHHTALLSMRFSFDDRKLRIHQQRIYLYGKKPIISLGAELGLYQLCSQRYRVYARLHATLQQNISAGMAGRIHYALQVGRIIGAVPYPLLNAFYGNETYSFDRYRLTLLNNFHYTADAYAELHVLWNMQGLLFNVIPGINRLKLRELIVFKAAYGTLKQHHADVIPFPVNYMEMEKPYAEAGFGIGNILSVADLLFVWRLTNRSDHSSPTWGVRFRLHLDL
ncbi:MAG TPA: hypothetical protein DEO38_04965 [Bacteroidales bacterium]|nr:hypothetical protein [Bacteroidales bacterium]